MKDLVRRILASTVVVLVSGVTHAEESALTSKGFSEECPTLMAQSDSFAADCLSNARTLTRMWTQWPGIDPGVPETHSAYFQSSTTGSHFQLGCTLDKDRHFANFGVYYAVDPNVFRSANSAQIASIAYDGDVVLINDGQHIRLTLVRQFVTSSVRPGRYYDGRIKNCEPALGADGSTHWLHGKFSVAITHSGDDVFVQADPRTAMGTYCSSDKPHPYVQLMSKKNSGPIFAALACSFFILDDGGLLVAEEPFERFCVNHTWRNGLIGEACPTK